MGNGRMNAHTLQIEIRVNGRSHRIEVDTRSTLLHVLRNELGLTGSKRGCDRGECGSCTVLLNDEPVNSCMVLAATTSGAQVRTVEGLASEGLLHPIQQAFLENDGAQCGFCTPGFLMSATALLETTSQPAQSEVRDALAGNICRCNAYGRIIESVKSAGSPR